MKNKAQTIWERLQKLEQIDAGIYFASAELWYALKKDGLFSQVFGGDLGWRSFLSECDQKISTVDQKVSNYGKWVVELGYKPEELTGIHVNKLFFAIAHTTKANKDDILSKAKNLSFSDFKAELTGKEPVCDHHDTKNVKKCAKCKKLLDE